METNKRATITNLTLELACELMDAGFGIYWTENNTFELSRQRGEKKETFMSKTNNESRKEKYPIISGLRLLLALYENFEKVHKGKLYASAADTLSKKSRELWEQRNMGKIFLDILGDEFQLFNFNVFLSNLDEPINKVCTHCSIKTETQEKIFKKIISKKSQIEKFNTLLNEIYLTTARRVEYFPLKVEYKAIRYFWSWYSNLIKYTTENL